MAFALDDNDVKEVPNITEENAKNSKSKRQNGTIKDNIKENKKDNNKGKEKCNDFFKNKLKNIDKLMATLDDMNAKYCEQEIIDSYMNMHNSNLMDEYKWDCNSLNEYINSYDIKVKYRDKSLQDILKDYEDHITSSINDRYGFWG